MGIKFKYFIGILLLSFVITACDTEGDVYVYTYDSEQDTTNSEDETNSEEDGDNESGDDIEEGDGSDSSVDSNNAADNIDYIPISTVEELAKIGVDDSYPLDGDYTLLENINLSIEIRSDATSAYWTPIGSYDSPFTGSFDGCDYTISGLKIDTEENSQGLFGYIKDAVIENVTLKDPSVIGGSSVGAVIGTVFGSSVIQNCRVEGGSISGSSAVGGVAGRASEDEYSITIIYCHNSSTVTSSGVIGIIGGIAGVADNITNCYNMGEISGRGHVGGIAGAANTITACYNMGNISASSSAAGGIVGNAYVEITPITITACYNIGDVSGGSAVGGVIGNAYASTGSIIITSCYSRGAISGSSNIGGIAGSIYADPNYSGVVDMISCYFIDQEGDDAMQGVGSDSSSEYDDMTISSISALNEVVDVMNSQVEENYFVAGSPADSVLPYLSWE